jgi:hypothetical protein
MVKDKKRERERERGICTITNLLLLSLSIELTKPVYYCSLQKTLRRCAHFCFLKSNNPKDTLTDKLASRAHTLTSNHETEPRRRSALAGRQVSFGISRETADR